MQNTPQTFRGVGAPGVNFNDHSYDNHVGGHCQPAGYQPYPSPPYHPIPSPRPHLYGNHQMQQSMPYRHHGGAYAPNQNQYGQNINQEMYRNHHSGYVPSPSNRNMPAKSWPENNTPADLMPPYGQVSHPQMMNNPAQMPVNTMRSPPHATSNMNPAPPQSQQHFRQMQSPAHSPHSWSQAQIPSPGVMHSSRTTPSPAHVRSPGHSQQPFSPPTAMNMPPHPPENGQIPPAMNSAGGAENPSNPLHSLQKMVMLDQDPSKAIMPMMGDGSEPFPNQCGPHNYMPEDGASNESKDSSYSTYYNMDENRFESKPNNTTTEAYSTVQQVSNCNFPVPPHPINSNEAKGSSNTPSIPDGLSSDHSLSSSKSSPSSVPLMPCNSNAGTNDPSLNLADCPPHAESAPVFTDQTRAAVSNSEQALESKVSSNSSFNVLPGDPETPAADVPNSQVAEEPVSSSEQVAAPGELEEAESPVQVKSEDTNQNEKVSNPPPGSEVPLADDKKENESSQIFDVKCKEEKCDPESTPNEKYSPAIIKVQAEVHNSDIDSGLVCEKTAKETCDTMEGTTKCDENACSDKDSLASSSSLKSEKDVDATIVKLSPKCDNLSIDPDCSNDSKAKELARNPVKVVIHRIRKDDTNDTWHVPSKESGEEKNSVDKKPETAKVPNVGPQIVILSPAVPQKKFGFHSSVAENNVITIDEDDSVEALDKDELQSKSQNSKGGGNTSSPGSNACGQSPDKKRGRPVGSKNKLKPSAAVKRKRGGGKGSRKKKSELSSKSKVAEIPSKPKKVKIFSGPYVHIVGSKENPSSIKVINVAQKEEEKVNKPSTVKRNFSSTVNRIKKKPIGHLSTLSPTYDAFNKDKTWLCVFCHKGSHHGGLGDLYGPYYIKDKNLQTPKLSSAASNSSGSGSARRKRCRSEADESRSSKKSKQASGHTPIESTPVKSALSKDSFLDSESPDLREVWIHEDCAVWCQSISLIGEEVQGLEEAVTEAREHICCKCSLHGATLGCWGKCCKEQYHFSCAKETGCQMDIENFSLLCPKHQKKSPERRNRCQ